MKSIIGYIEKLAPFIGGYPVWFQYSLALWVLLTAVLFVGLVLMNPALRGTKEPATTDIDSLNVQLRKLVQGTLAIPPPLAERYADVVKSPEAGITKLLSDGSTLEKAIRGGGTYWSFLRRDHEYGHGSDIQLQVSQFSTGFAGANYGYILRLGEIAIRQVLDTAGPTPPSWLEPGRREAWKYMWDYVPPREIKEIRQHQTAARGLVKGNATLSETAPAIAEEAYLLRSIQIGDSDILVAFQVVDKYDDGSVVIVWKVVRIFDTPVAMGRE